MDINYIHVRQWAKPRAFLDIDWQHQLRNYGGATIAYTIHRVADSIIVKYAVAECCDKDRFIKQTGRAIAMSRLVNENYAGTIELPNDLEDDIQEMLVEDFLVIKEQAILDSSNGEWVKEVQLRDYWQPVNPGYEWQEMKCLEGCE